MTNSPNGNALCDSRLGITKPFDGHQVQSCALLIGKLDERLLNLAKADVDDAHLRANLDVWSRFYEDRP